MFNTRSPRFFLDALGLVLVSMWLFVNVIASVLRHG